jgi:hypothetical protein
VTKFKFKVEFTESFREKFRKEKQIHYYYYLAMTNRDYKTQETLLFDKHTLRNLSLEQIFPSDYNNNNATSLNNTRIDCLVLFKLDYKYKYELDRLKKNSINCILLESIDYLNWRNYSNFLYFVDLIFNSFCKNDVDYRAGFDEVNFYFR